MVRAVHNRLSERDIAIATLRIAAMQANGVASFARLKREIPGIVRMSANDLQQSATRPNEPMWQQQIRNIRSHHQTPGNFINDGYLEHIPRSGYRITQAGHLYLQRNRLL